jgi:hypothetical protein
VGESLKDGAMLDEDLTDESPAPLAFPCSPTVPTGAVVDGAASAVDRVGSEVWIGVVAVDGVAIVVSVEPDDAGAARADTDKPDSPDALAVVLAACWFSVTSDIAIP